MTTYSIYKIINRVNDKFYVGYSHSPKRRFWQHTNKKHQDNNPNSILYHSMRKYGVECFSYEILYQSVDKNHIIDMESYFIETLKPEYNISSGGTGGDLSSFVSPQTRHSINENLKRWSEYQKGKTYEEIYGKEKSELIVQRKRESHPKTINISDKERQRRSISFIENNPMKDGHTDESRQRISDSLKRKYEDEGFHWNGKTHTPSTKNIMKESRKGKVWYNNPTTKETVMCLEGHQPEGFIRGRGQVKHQK